MSDDKLRSFNDRSRQPTALPNCRCAVVPLRGRSVEAELKRLEQLRRYVMICGITRSLN